MKQVNNWAPLAALAAAVVFVTVLVGWVINLFELFGNLGVVDAVFIMRVLGIFLVPIGAIMGYFF